MGEGVLKELYGENIDDIKKKAQVASNIRARKKDEKLSQILGETDVEYEREDGEYESDYDRWGVPTKYKRNPIMRYRVRARMVHRLGGVPGGVQPTRTCASKTLLEHARDWLRSAGEHHRAVELLQRVERQERERSARGEAEVSQVPGDIPTEDPSRDHRHSRCHQVLHEAQEERIQASSPT